ncbi:MAG: transporter substrate-binding domain-containing protein [Bdellovibrio sp.]|nr:transporter substrate-binding domain-containing protein [Bdellovibrio sp.]
MRILQFFLIVFVFFLLLPAALAQTACKRLIAYGNPEYPPYLWNSKNGSDNMMGANADFIKLLAQEIGLPIAVKYGGTWARVQEEARYGRVDLVAGAFVTQERKKYLHYFYPAIFQTRTIIWVHRDRKFPFKEWSDLKSKNGITVLNNSFGEKFDKYAKVNLQIQTVASLAQAFNMLKNNRAQYLIYEEWPAKAYALRYKYDELIPLSPEISNEALFLAFSKKSPCNAPELRAKIEHAIMKISKKEVLEKLLIDNSRAWEHEN